MLDRRRTASMEPSLETLRTITTTETNERMPKKAKKVKKASAAEPSPPPGIVRTQREVARAFGVTTRTVQNWIREGCPKAGENYDLLAIERWHKEQQERRQGTSPPEEDSKEHWEKEYRRVRTELSELQLKQAQGELLSKADVAAGRNQRILVAKRAFLGLPERIVPALQGLKPRQQVQLLKDRLEEIIKEFAGQE